MADPHPKNEVDNGKTPGSRDIVAPGSDADCEAVADTNDPNEKSKRRQRKRNKPGYGRFLVNITEDLIVQFAGADRTDDYR